MAPAFNLAANGFPTSHVLSQAIAADPAAVQFPHVEARCFTKDGRPLRTRRKFCGRKTWPRTFQAIADGGRDAFYQGDIARAIVKFSEELGGLLTTKDFADSHCRWQQPISTTYHGYTVYEAPPNSSGHILLQELNMVEEFDLRSMGCTPPRPST